jgi:hypothetical protein
LMEACPRLRVSSANSESEAIKVKGLQAVPAGLRSTLRLMEP